eukprot:TRINITY_DN5243_c0_g2_i1.p1 TRINITY_DN5243_c0_g2~~TRINITY_DN5243_c0_g2_i1.p1  ORF type:complete len:514 (-),score=63.88 TRINITY_DN5243_c0_g2_i1:77-1618(-)
MSSTVRNICGQPGYMPPLRTTPVPSVYGPSAATCPSLSMQRTAEISNPTNIRTQRASSSKGWAGPGETVDSYNGGCGDCGVSGVCGATAVGAIIRSSGAAGSTPANIKVATAAPATVSSVRGTNVAKVDKSQAPVQDAPARVGPIRANSGGQPSLLSPKLPLPSRAATVSVPIPTAELVTDVASVACLDATCPTCMDMKHHETMLCRLPCGHIVQVQLVDSDSKSLAAAATAAAAASGTGLAPKATIATLASIGDRDNPGQKGIIRQASALLNPVPPDTPYSSAPMSPSRGPASPSSPQHTPSMMYRRPNASTTSFSIPREQHRDPHIAQQITSRSCAGSGVDGEIGQGALSRVGSLAGENVYRQRTHDGGMGTREDLLTGNRAEVLRLRSAGDPRRVTDCRGNLLVDMCDVILLSPKSRLSMEQELHVRGKIVGLFSRERDVGPELDDSSQVQVLVTFVDASERNTPLMFPSEAATVFGDTETHSGNVIKWKACFCKLGKKFSPSNYSVRSK